MEIIILVGEKYLYYGLVLLGVSFESNEEYLLFVKLIFTHITQVCVCTAGNVWWLEEKEGSF